jgi:hypothetical protein
VIETTVDGDKRRLEQETFPYLIAGEETLSITVEDPAAPTEETPPPAETTEGEGEAEPGSELLQNESPSPDQPNPEQDLPDDAPDPTEPDPNDPSPDEPSPNNP